MKIDDLAQELEEVARKLSVRVSYEDLRWEGPGGKGGSCRVHDERRIIINKALNKEDRALILARELGKFPLEEISVPPRVREFIEDSRADPAPEGP
ncbi:MAG: hypothetical protein A2V83_08615 [Nitrospirae bacterium RBG_16_64_22]|nr:MAG: hypothetical protein A2V83_08615 [Nitrospirae bacterium RBG_16_64_22]